MFQFTTTTVINNVDKQIEALRARVLNGDTYGDGDYIALKVIGMPILKKDCIVKVYKHAGNDAEVATATIDARKLMTTVKDPETGEQKVVPMAGQWQLYLDILLPDSVDSSYARSANYIKGKPLYYGFEIADDDEPADIAKKIADAVKFVNTRFNDKTITVEVAENGYDVVISGTNEFQVFNKVQLLEYLPVANDCVCADHCECAFQDSGIAVEIKANKEGFGTAFQIMKDLRLPTGQNTRWTAPNAAERPVLGTIYDQYTIQYVTRRGIMGISAVGELVASATNHVLFIPQDQAAKFTTILGNLGIGEKPGGDGRLEEFPTPSNETSNENTENPAEGGGNGN